MIGGHSHYLPSVPPTLGINHLPETERQSGNFVERGLFHLSRCCDDFEAALRLFNFVDALPHGMRLPRGQLIGVSWSLIAAKAAATAVFLMDEEMEYIKVNLNGCPTLAGLHDAEKRRSATKAFAKYFPGFDGVRHGAQHSAKLYGTPERAAENCRSGFIMTNNLIGNMLTTDYKQGTVTLGINDQSFQWLREIRDLYWSAFVAEGRGRLVPRPQLPEPPPS